MWSCDLSKALGSDGLNMNFIRKIWDVVGADFTSTVMRFFLESKLDKALNMTWVTLIPKVEGTKEMKDF